MAKRDDAPDEVVRGGKNISYRDFERQSSRPVQQEPVQPVQQAQQPIQQQQAPTVVQNPMPTPETPPMQGNYAAYAKYSNQLSAQNRAAELRRQAAQQGLTALQNANANTMKGYEERLAALRRSQENTQAAYEERMRLADQEANIRKQANEAARQAALQQALGNYGLQKDTLAQQADDAARQAYISRMIAERDLGQQLAAAGYTGGMAESSRLGLLTNYENNRNSILRDRDSNLAAIDLAMRNAEAQTAADIANQNAGFDLQNLTTRGNLYTGMMEAMSQGDTNLAGLYAQMLNAQSQGDTNLANYLSNMANQEAENEIALANLYAQMTGATGSGTGGGSSRTGTTSRSSGSVKKYTSDELKRIGYELSEIDAFENAYDALSWIQSVSNDRERQHQLVDQLVKKEKIEETQAAQINRMIDTNYTPYTTVTENPAERYLSGLTAPAITSSGVNQSAQNAAVDYRAFQAAISKLRSVAGNSVEKWIDSLEQMEANGEIDTSLADYIATHYIESVLKSGR